MTFARTKIHGRRQVRSDVGSLGKQALTEDITTDGSGVKTILCGEARAGVLAVNSATIEVCL